MLGAIAALSTKRKGDRKPYEVEGDRTSEGMMNDRQQSEGLWAILFERLRQREVDESRPIAQTPKVRGDREFWRSGAIDYLSLLFYLKLLNLFNSQARCFCNNFWS
jgi:hypothetical protein